MLRKGNEFFIEDLRKLAEEKRDVLVQTNTGLTLYHAFELLSWQVKSILKIRMFEPI